MLEDHTMDKKNRSSQSLNKGNPSEPKKSQDVSSNKQLPKQSRRREPAGSVPKNEASGRTKPVPQKSKSFDKRPKPRSSFGSGKEGSKINLYEDEPELGSLYTPGSKKQSLNHLLNFQYASPAGQYGSSGGRNSYGGRSQARIMDYSMGYNNYLMQSLASVHKHKYNKEQFLQANCQFVVCAGEDYGVHLADPDQLVKWEFIQQIRGFGNEDIKCPICLDAPRAAQMTRCGHTYCWPCVLHYLALSDKTWRKCPICYEAIHPGDLKSFRAVIRSPRRVTQEVTFQLMKRERGSTIVSPLAQWDLVEPDVPMNVSETQLDTTYAKLLTASVDNILDIINEEEAELVVLLEELRREQCPTLCFTERALELLHKRKSDVLEKINKRDNQTTDIGDGGQSFPDTVQSPHNSLKESSPEISSITMMDRETTSTGPKLAQSKPSNNEACTTSSEQVKMNTDQINMKKQVDVIVDLTHINELNNKTDRDLEDNFGANATICSVQGWEECGESGATSEIDGAMVSAPSEHGDFLLDDHSELYDEAYSGRSRYESISSEEPGAHGTTSIRAEDLYFGPPAHSTPPQPSRFFYFYQAQDGQHLYLHAVNVRMLEMSYGSLEHCPPVITAQDGQHLYLHAVNVRMLEMSYGSLEHCPPVITGVIVEKETGSMTAELRNRLRYLQHLPVTCQFEVAEIQLKPPLVSPEAMDRFKDQLASRERRRAKRAREDKRRAARIDEVQYAQMRGGGVSGGGAKSGGRRGRLYIESRLQFPECGMGGVPGLSSALGSASVSTESSRASSPRRPESPLTTALIALSLEQQENPSTASFAQRLRAGSSLSANDNAVFWPSVGAQRERNRTVSEEAECSTSHSYALSLAQIMGAKNSPPKGASGQNEQATTPASGAQNSSSNSKKKKRKQQTLLFATGGMTVNK